MDAIFESMADALAQGDRIQIRRFGSFTVKHRPPHEGRNQKTGESIFIPARRLPFFKIGKELHERINRSVPSAGSMEEDS